MLAALLTNIRQLGGGAGPSGKPKRGKDYTPIERKGLKKQVQEWVDEIVLTQDRKPLSIKAKGVIAPYRETVDFSVDWKKLQKDIKALEQLLLLYHERENYRLKLLQDDDDFMVIMYASLI